jgi:hypothetical protein
MHVVGTPDPVVVPVPEVFPNPDEELPPPAPEPELELDPVPDVVDESLHPTIARRRPRGATKRVLELANVKGCRPL